MPVRKDADGYWHAEVCVDRRRLHRRLPLGSGKSDANLVEAELTTALNAQRASRATPIPGNPQLAELLGHYAQQHALNLRSTDTAQYHAYRITKWIEGRRASDTREVVASIVEDLTGVYAPATINRSLGTLKKALKLAWEKGRVQTDYSSLVKRLPENNARTTTLTMKQVQTLANHASETVRAAIWIALFTGCRRGEILAMKPADVGRTEITIQAGNTKTLRTRTVPIIPPVRPWLKLLPLAINFEGLKSGFERARIAAGMPEVNFHDLRRSCGTLLIQRRVPLHVVSKLLGHTSTTVTERVYAHLGARELRQGLSVLGDLHRDLHRKSRKVA